MLPWFSVPVQSRGPELRFRVALLLSFAVAVMAYFALTRAGRDPAPAHVRHVVLVTIDTLRADRLGSYGHTAARTPAFDTLARHGTRFARAYATAPITLPSHATILTGRYPPGHGARHNGMAMNAGLPTLQASFKQAGFETAAFVSAFPLDRRFGLDRGFDAYDDELPRGADGRRQNERAGAATVDRAIAWLRARPAARLFAWVHLFEPHAPYAAPGSVPGRSASDRYDDEVATADREVARLLDAWPDRADTLVVMTADHGEAFGEHGESGHSIFVYDTTLHVPLIMAGPGLPDGATIEDPVSLIDLAPTIAGLAGLSPIAADGVDLRPSMARRRSEARAIYAESFAPLLDFGWAPLRTVRLGGMKLIAAPRPELYDLSSDPREERNAIGTRSDVARDLAERIERISPAELRAGSAPDPDAVARLRALGYASGGGPSRGGVRPDPKDRIGVASRIAQVTSGEVKGLAAEEALREALRVDANNPQAHQRLGFLLAERGQCPAAEPHFSAAIATELPSADPHLGLALCQATRGATQEALATLRRGREAEPGNPVIEANIGLIELQAGNLDGSIDALGRALATDPDLHQARFALARALARRGNRSEALRQATELLSRLPQAAPQRAEVERLIAVLR